MLGCRWYVLRESFNTKALRRSAGAVRTLDESLGGKVKDPKVPTQIDLMWPTIEALVKIGGSASIQEISRQIAAIMQLSDEVLEIRHGSGPQSEVDYRAAWARNRLKLMSAVVNSKRGIWSITDRGRRLSSAAQVKKYDKKAQAAESSKRRNGVDSDNDPEPDINEQSWEDNLLSVLKRMKPVAFERLCQRLLRESGFINVEVTGQTGDGGIDGVGVLRINLLSFHVLFQCKRYDGAVGAGFIRDFRGAMVGRTDKGLFLTTGYFTKDAVQEAVRDGAPSIDLIDGMEMCRLLKSLELGVRTQIMVDENFFDSI